MSINLMQAFVYETDELKSLDIMLRAAARCAFKDEPPGKYTALHLQVRQPSSFDSGREYHFEQQPMIAPTGNVLKYHTLLPDRVYGGATVLKVLDAYKDIDDAAAAACEHHKERHPPTDHRRWITTLSDYKSDVREGDPVFKSVDDLCDEAMKIMSEAKVKQGPAFASDCGDGYNSWFNHNDGSVDIGYRIQYRPNGGWNNLDLCLVHVYYGK